MRCGELRESEKLIARALIGNPHHEIAEELRGLFEQVQFARHLELKGVTLSPMEFQMSLAGNVISEGMAKADVFTTRAKLTENLFYRTYERMKDLGFRSRGGPRPQVRDECSFYVSVPREGSFAVTFRIGQPATAAQGRLIDGPAQILSEAIDCIELYVNAEFEALQERIPDSDYLRNFTSLARLICPDGRRISFVGLTIWVAGERVRTLQLTSRPRPLPRKKEEDTPEEQVTVVGELRFADSRRRADGQEIVLEDDTGQEFRIAVPPGMMSDIVKPLWEERVSVSGLKRQGVIYLEFITPASDEEL
jgi:hypothetical protein